MNTAKRVLDRCMGKNNEYSDDPSVFKKNGKQYRTILLWKCPSCGAEQTTPKTWYDSDPSSTKCNECGFRPGSEIRYRVKDLPMSKISSWVR